MTTKAAAPFNELEAKSYALFAKYGNCAQKPLTQTCKKCINPDGGYKMFFFYQYTRMKRYHYKMLIHYNDASKQVVISFGAPSVDNYSYISMIYSRGWSYLRKYKIRVEREFKLVYFRNLRKILIQKLLKLKKSGRHGYKYVFTGYSLGGSLAVLAAFDLTKSKLLRNRINHTTCYTYGALRIGDHKFVNVINNTIALWRVVKQDDYIVRIPNCYFSVIANAWRCFTAPVIRKFIITNKFPLRTYYKNYVGKGPLGKLFIYNRNHQHLNNVKPHHLAHKFAAHKVMQKVAHNMRTHYKQPVVIHKTAKTTPKIVHTNNEKTMHPASKDHHKKIAKIAHHKNVKTQNKNEKKAATPSSFLQLSSNKNNRQMALARRQWVQPRIVPRNSLSHVRKALLSTYYKYIYYTQPLGRLIYYSPDMTTYRSCAYIAGISNCEKVINLPNSFNTNSHKNYYGINFEQC
jgi:hypothetical protein